MSATYPTSQITRVRATKSQIDEWREDIYRIVQRMRPMSVRQVFYQATVHGIVEKTENGYNKIRTDLVAMRRSGELPYGWLADNTRWQRKPDTFKSVQHALSETARFYRKSLWHDADAYVEIWLEKDALSGMIYPVTAEYDVPVMVARGYASLSFLHSAAEHINDLEVPTFIYHLGDYDPSGVNADEKIEQTLRELAPNADITFQRTAVTPAQIEEWRLPTRPTKTSHSRFKGFGDITVELDAIEPHRLRALVREALEVHLPQDWLNSLKIAEQSEKAILTAFVREAGR